MEHCHCSPWHSRGIRCHLNTCDAWLGRRHSVRRRSDARIAAVFVAKKYPSATAGPVPDEIDCPDGARGTALPGQGTPSIQERALGVKEKRPALGGLSSFLGQRCLGRRPAGNRAGGLTCRLGGRLRPLRFASHELADRDSSSRSVAAEVLPPTVHIAVQMSRPRRGGCETRPPTGPVSSG